MYSLLYPAYILVTNNCNTHFGKPGADGDNIWTNLVNDVLNSVMHLRASRKAGNFLTIWATTSCCCWRTLRPSILACSNGDTARTTGLIGLQRPSCFCHSHVVMNFTSSSTHSQKPSYGDDHCGYGAMLLFWNKCPVCWRHRPPLSLVTWVCHCGGVSPPVGQYADIQPKSTRWCCANGPTIYYWVTDALWQSHIRSCCNKHS